MFYRRAWTRLTQLFKAEVKASKPSQGFASPFSQTVFDLDREAVVHYTVYPGRSGRVYFQGAWWPARCPDNTTLYPGETVYVIGVVNITLLVEPISSAPALVMETVRS
ncbi:MAG: NfeD family protein [Leptolyngbyaceae cyanobacterium bins.59]|nr:NfeD family protein [Leptolyngbyaceae cyanobacterium bins.59]